MCALRAAWRPYPYAFAAHGTAAAGRGRVALFGRQQDLSQIEQRESRRGEKQQKKKWSTHAICLVCVCVSPYVCTSWKRIFKTFQHKHSKEYLHRGGIFLEINGRKVSRSFFLTISNIEKKKPNQNFAYQLSYLISFASLKKNTLKRSYL